MTACASQLSQRFQEQRNETSEISQTRQETRTSMMSSETQQTTCGLQIHDSSLIVLGSSRTEELCRTEETFNTVKTSRVQETCETQEKRQFYDETSDTSSSSTVSLGERFAADSAQRYTATQNLLRIGRRDKEQEIQEQEREIQEQQEIQEQPDQELKDTGCIVGKHKEVITACLQELEQSSYSSVTMQVVFLLLLLLLPFPQLLHLPLHLLLLLLYRIWRRWTPAVTWSS